MSDPNPVLMPQLYLRAAKFTTTRRFVVRPANTTHVVLVEHHVNGAFYVWIEDLQPNKTWKQRLGIAPQACDSLPLAERAAAQLHRAEHRKQKEASHGTTP